jgi:hypothetical protein
MSRRVDLPTDDDVRRVMREYLDEAKASNIRATVIGLARRLNLSNGTFWRQFPAIAEELKSESMTTPPPEQRSDRVDLRADNASLRRRNASLTDDIALATASIQRLTLENRALRAELENVSKVVSIPRA